MRLASRVDDNQNALVRLWRQMGVSVWITSGCGKGAPDVVLGLLNAEGEPVNLLVEIKDGSKPLSSQKLTQDEMKFHTAWRGQICIVRSEADAMNLIYRTRSPR